MNIADKMERESRLLANLVSWMESHGEVLSDRSRSNHYVGVRIRTIRWHGRVYTAVDVDGMTCRLEREEEGYTEAPKEGVDDERIFHSQTRERR